MTRFLKSLEGVIVLLMLSQIICAFSQPTIGFAAGELFSIRAPEEVPEGDNFTLIITGSGRETYVDRVLVLDFPEGWSLERVYAVEAGSDWLAKLVPASSVARLFTADVKRKIVALTDTSTEFNPEAAGIAYFATFSGISPGATASFRAQLVERTQPDSPPEIDKKTKKPKPINSEWRAVSPSRDDFTFAGTAGKKLTATIRLSKVPRTSRALVLDGARNASAILRTHEESLSRFFANPFTIEAWFRTTEPLQTLLTLRKKDEDGYVRFFTNAFGQLQIYERQGREETARPEPGKLIGTKTVSADGVWHHLAFSVDSNHRLKIFVDGHPVTTREVDQDMFKEIVSVELGGLGRPSNLGIDELRFLQRSYNQLSDFAPFLVRAARDTLSDAFALFHFDEYGTQARSSVPVQLISGRERILLPSLFVLDTNAVMEVTTSPVQSDQVLLTAEMVTPTKVSLGWRVTSEIGVKKYRLERRVGGYGSFEQVIEATAKHGVKAPKKNQSLISRAAYQAVEELPKVRGDIELFYRVAVVNFDDSTHYSEPVKLEYGGDRDVFVEQNEPNPFNPITTIPVRVVRGGLVRIAIYDIIGREVVTLHNGKLEPGRHTYSLDATNWPGGIYFYKVKTNKTTVTRKMVLAK